MSQWSALFGVNRADTSIIQVAVSAVRAGLAVLPVASGSKTPVCTLTDTARRKEDREAAEVARLAGNPRWQKARHACGINHAITKDTTARSVFQRMLADDPDLNLGLEVGRSRLVCVDTDNAADVAAFTKYWAAESGFSGIEGIVPTVSSPGVRKENGEWSHKGGGHFWFSLPESIEIDYSGAPLDLVPGADVVVYSRDRLILVPPSVRPEGPYVLNSDIGVCPSWLLDRIEEQQERATARKARHTSNASQRGSDDAILAWAVQTPWAQLLTEDGWSQSGRYESCTCEIWTRPGDWSDPKSATAHEPGCTQWDADGGNCFLHVWTDSPPDYIAAYRDATGSKSMSKLQYVAWRDYAGDYSAAMFAFSIQSTEDQALVSLLGGGVEYPKALAGPEPSITATTPPAETSEEDDAAWLTGSPTTLPPASAETAHSSDPSSSASPIPESNPYLDLLMLKERARRHVKNALDMEEREAVFEFPETADTLADELVIEDEPLEYTVDGLLMAGGNALLTSTYKAGKTTLLINLMRALCDQTLFLDKFAVRPLTGRVAWINYELTRQQAKGWLRDMGFEHPENGALLSLRGYSVPITTELGKDALVRWLKERNVEVVLADPFSAASSGEADENDNSEVRQWLSALDEVKRRAGVRDLILTTHTGRGDQSRSRGASVLEGWSDANWLLTLDEEMNRYFAARGRDVDVSRVALEYDEPTRTLSVVDYDPGTLISTGGQKQDPYAAILGAIGFSTGMSVKAIQGTTQMQLPAINRFLDEMILAGRVWVDENGLYRTEKKGEQDDW